MTNQTLSLRYVGLLEPDSLELPAALQSLDLTGNSLSRLPDGIAHLSELRSLYLDENRLTAIPASFEQLTCLRHLHVDGNCSLFFRR